MKRYDTDKIKELAEDFIASNAVRIPMSSYGIYFLTHNGRVVYVGKGKDPYIRVSTHTKDKVFDGFFVMQSPPDTLDELEAFFIRKFNPIFNVSMNDSHGYSQNENSLARIVYLRFCEPKERCLAVARLLNASNLRNAKRVINESSSMEELESLAMREVDIIERFDAAMSDEGIIARMRRVGMTHEWASRFVPTMGVLLSALATGNEGIKILGAARRNILLDLCYMKELADSGVLPNNGEGFSIYNFRDWVDSRGLVCPVRKFIQNGY